MKQFKLSIALILLLLVSCNSDSSLSLTDSDLRIQSENLSPKSNAKKNAKAFQVFRVNNLLVLDGLENDWDDVPKRKLRQELDLGSPIDSKFDLSSHFKILWDDEYLHIFVSVVDEEINFSGMELFERDGVEFYIDGDNSKNVDSGAPISFPPQAYDDNDDFFRFIPNETVALGAWEIINTDNFEFVIMTTERGYDVEIRMPFDDLPALTAESGSEFGFEFQVNDNDDNERQNSLKWNSSLDNSFFDPSTFATAVLTNSIAE